MIKKDLKKYRNFLYLFPVLKKKKQIYFQIFPFIHLINKFVLIS